MGVECLRGWHGRESLVVMVSIAISFLPDIPMPCVWVMTSISGSNGDQIRNALHCQKENLMQVGWKKNWGPHSYATVHPRPTRFSKLADGVPLQWHTSPDDLPKLGKWVIHSDCDSRCWLDGPCTGGVWFAIFQGVGNF